MGLLAKAIKDFSNQSLRPVRIAEIFDLSKLEVGLDAKVYAKIRYVDPIEYRIDQGSIADPDFRETIAKEFVDGISDSRESLESGSFGTIKYSTLRVVCSKLWGLNPEALNAHGDGSITLADKDDVVAIVKNMDGMVFASLFYECTAIAEFVRKEIENQKNSLKPTSGSQTPPTPQDSVEVKA